MLSDYGPILLLMPFGFRLTADNLPSLPVSLTFRASQLLTPAFSLAI
jgi:hypothetical protein